MCCDFKISGIELSHVILVLHVKCLEGAESVIQQYESYYLFL